MPVNFPVTIDDNVSLHLAKNNVRTTLAAQLLVGETTTMEVLSTALFDAAGYLSVDDEVIHYASKDPTHFLTLIRAQDGTSAAQHEAGVPVELRILALHHNDPKDAIIALETKIGVDSSAVATTIDYLLKNALSVNPGHLHDDLTFLLAGLKVKDVGGSHYLTISPGSTLVSNRTLTITTGDADRTITLSGNPTLADWFDQSVKQAASPTLAGLTLTAFTGVLKATAGAVGGSATLDDVADGSSYARVAIADITSSHVIQLIAGGQTLTPISTTSDTIQLNSGATGVKIKDTSGSLAVRAASDLTYSDVYCNSIYLAGSFVTDKTDISGGVTSPSGDEAQFLGFGWLTTYGGSFIQRNFGQNIYQAVVGDITVTGHISPVYCYERVSSLDYGAIPVGVLAHTFSAGPGATTWTNAPVGYYQFRSATLSPFSVLYKGTTSIGGGTATFTQLIVTGDSTFYQTESATKIKVQNIDAVTIFAVDTTNDKVKAYNYLEFITNATIASLSGDINIGNGTGEIYFGPDGGATPFNIKMENGAIAVRYNNVAGAVAIGNAVYISAVDTVAPAKANAIATMPAIGVVVAIPATTYCWVAEFGRVEGLTFASSNANVYVSHATAGLLTLTVPSGANAVVQKMGKSRSTTGLDLDRTQQFLVLN